MNNETFAVIGLISAVICAKWAMELGLTQARQLLWGIGGLILGPIAMLVLYLRMLRQAPEAARRWA